MDRLKPFSEDITTGSFREIELSTGSPEWRNLLAKIGKWKQEGGILQAKLKGKPTPVVLPIEEEVIEEEGWTQDIEEAKHIFRHKTDEEKAKELDWLQWQADAEREQPKGIPLSEEQLEKEWNSFDLYWKTLFDEAKDILIKHIQSLPQGWTPYAELKLKLGSPDWQKLREEIRRWKKTGGVLRAKLKGKEDEVEQKKRISELISKRGPALTTEEEDEIAATPGIIPPWWGKPGKDSYYAGAIKAIQKLGVSALDVHLAVERDYTNKPITEKEKEILRVGWGYPVQDVGYGEIEPGKYIKEPISKKALKLTSEEKDKIRAIPGIIPPWWPKDPGKDLYYRNAMKAIKKLGVSALDVHLATEKSYTGKALTAKEQKILMIGWGDEEYDEKSKLAITSSNLAKYLLTKQGLKASVKTFGKIVAKLSSTMMSPWLIPLIWSPEIIDIAKSKDIQKVWKNMQDESWWKEAAKRDEIVRGKAKRGEKVVFSKNVIPYGEFYHRDKGWY